MATGLDPLQLAYLTYFVGACSPGPSNLAIMRVAMSSGRLAAAGVVGGVLTGTLFWASLAATGLAAVMQARAEAMLAVRVGGGAYLLLLAWRLGKASLTGNPTRLGIAIGEEESGLSSLYLRGLLIHLGNPKAILSWMATMALGLPPGSSPQMPYVILCGCLILSLLVYASYVVLFSLESVASLYLRAQQPVDGLLAIFYLVAGAKLLVG